VWKSGSVPTEWRIATCGFESRSIHRATWEWPPESTESWDVPQLEDAPVSPRGRGTAPR